MSMHDAKSVSPPEAEGTTCLDEFPSSRQCDSTPAFQLKVILRREFDNLRSGCLHRTIPVDPYIMICDTCQLQSDQCQRLTPIVILQGITRQCRLAIP